MARAAGIAPYRTGLVGITDLVGTLVIASVVHEKHAGLIGAIDNKERES